MSYEWRSLGEPTDVHLRFVRTKCGTHIHVDDVINALRVKMVGPTASTFCDQFELEIRRAEANAYGKR